MRNEPTDTRRPIEAIESRVRRSVECEQRVRKALTKLVRTGAPFTVEDVCTLARVGKTFIYDKRHPDLTQAVLAARDASRTPDRISANTDGESQSWKERAMNAEALARALRTTVKEQAVRISDLTGELFDPSGSHLAEQNSELRGLVQALSQRLRDAEMEKAKLLRSLDAARATIKRERERRVAEVIEFDETTSTRLSLLPQSRSHTADPEMT